MQEKTRWLDEPLTTGKGICIASVATLVTTILMLLVWLAN